MTLAMTIDHIITVVGNGKVLAVPDRTIVSITISILAPTVDEARERLDRQRAAVLTSLAKADVPDDSIHSDGSDFAPEHSYEDRQYRFKGIAGRENIRAAIHYEQGRTATIIRALGATLQHAKVDVSHELRDSTGAVREALASAVADARMRASTIADAAGIRLGRIRALKHGVAQPEGGRLFECQSASPALDAAPSLIAVEVAVTVTWDIEQ